MSRIDTLVADLARRQHGAFSLSQLQEQGGTDSLVHRRCQQGFWRRASRGVLVIAGVPSTFEQRAMVAVLAHGPGAVASHRTAARLWGIAGAAPVPIEVSVPYPRDPRRRGQICHRVRDLHLADAHIVSGIPVTGLARTVLDLGAVDRELTRSAMWRAMREHDLSWKELLGTLVDHSRRGRDGLGVLRSLIAQHYGVRRGDSDTEESAYRILVDSGRVPVPQRLVPVTCADGVTVTVDFAWPTYRVLVEVYGVDHLTNAELVQTDLHRINQLALAGWERLIVTGTMLRKPDRFVHEVRDMLQRRGWQPLATA